MLKVRLYREIEDKYFSLQFVILSSMFVLFFKKNFMGNVSENIVNPKKWLLEKFSIQEDRLQLSDKDLKASHKYGEVLENNIEEWFDFTFSHIVTRDEIRIIFENFQKRFESLIVEKINSPKESIFTSGLTPDLSAANTFTRSLSTTLGSVFEDIACLSSKVISPEKSFGKVKIKGVDLLIVDSSNLEIIFTQLKTAKGTLTGSQGPRSIKELSVFRKGIFAAALDLGDWTFNSNQIKRIAGQEFWELAGINEYEFIFEEAVRMFENLEDLFRSFISSSKL